jgi:hypothetical protein
MKKTTLVASAVASLFALGAYAADKAPSKEGKAASSIKCSGVNECKGHSVCASANNACAGKNECKAKGITMTSDADCKGKGGTVVAEAPKKK